MGKQKNGLLGTAMVLMLDTNNISKGKQKKINVKIPIIEGIKIRGWGYFTSLLFVLCVHSGCTQKKMPSYIREGIFFYIIV